MAKVYDKSKNVYDASKERIREQLNNFPDYYVSFSGGKDSGVLVNLVIEVAKEENKLPVKVVFSDLECIYMETERYVKSIMDLKEVEPYWLCLPEIDENASSIYERYYTMWDPLKKDIWARDMPKMNYVINEHNIPKELNKYLNLNSISEWSISKFGEFLCDKNKVDKICNFIGMRADESYGRHMTIATQKNRNKKNQYTYLTKDGCDRTWTSLPIYDWEFSDIWHYYSVNNLDYNRVYDSFLKIGLPYSEMRTCYALGEEQKKSLYIYSLIEPETYDRLVQRVQGVNFGKIYNKTNINRGKIKKPNNITWQEYMHILLADLPEEISYNFKEKFNIVYNYHTKMYCDKLGLDFEFIACDSRKESKEKAKENNMPIKYFFSYETLCGAIIKRDFVFKKYGFGYSKKMEDRITEIKEKWESKL